MKNKRGQVALEFLMTYGWAILIITVVSVLLWQFGLFNPSGQIKAGSSGFWGVTPYDDFVLKSDGTFKIAIENKVGGAVTIKKIYAKLNGEADTDESPEDSMGDPATANPGQMLIWTYQNSDPDLWKMPKGASYRAYISITYNDSRTSEEYVSSGWIWGNVEA